MPGGRKVTFVLVAVLAGLSAPLPARASAAVTIQRSRFTPRDVTVPAGETVVWTNNDGVGHSVTADDGSFDSHPGCGGVTGGCMNRGETFSTTFTRPGRVTYYCRTHGGPGRGMVGSVTVTG
ncbi:MAG TPA: plastocyanin/azurin family copper-binding protein [Acidimicrobiia bacterium]|nr:plastocyanin/azurin family copper-binding protein [Acidimicrobiia bacterium]